MIAAFAAWQWRNRLAWFLTGYLVSLAVVCLAIPRP